MPGVTYALYDDGGKFLAGRVMSEADSSMQVELDSGKRVKVKAANVLMRFDEPTPAELFSAAHAIAPDIDLDLAWEFAPDADFSFGDLARDYFDANAGVVQQTAALLRLFEAPHYFRRVGKGMFRKASEVTLKAALLGIERKQQLLAQIDTLADKLLQGVCPPAVRDQLYRILFKPDKNAPEYKAVVEASRRAQQPPLEVLQRAGAIESPYQFHWQRFLFDHFARGTGFPALDVPTIKDELPLASTQAFSIDDSTTTEIDDALSVQGLSSGSVRFGVHIAAPGLAIEPGSDLDTVARERMSTVYMPGHKITMLPDDVVDAYTLTAGRACPAISLYLDIDEASLAIRGFETRLERVTIGANLRHDQLDDVVTEATLCGEAPADYPFAGELAFAFRLARELKARREAVRGKPENFTRPDFSFRLASRADASEPDGSETVIIDTRQRGSTLDLLVAEAMILANSTWGGWLDQNNVPGIYRSQASMLPGVKVRMGSKALPHAGLGVAQYVWSTSPLRRYVDLVNQWQIIACARHGHTAALVAPFRSNDAALFSVISAFDAAYSAYNDFQRAIERYWALRWLAQNDVDALDTTVLKDGLVRADSLPLVFRASGTETLARGVRVRVRLNGIDELTLDVHATFVARIDDVHRTAAVAASADVAGTADEDDDDDATDAGALELAIDVGTDDAAAAPASP